MSCKHEEFRSVVTVNRIEDVGRFTADVIINCDQCGIPFRFIGLPAGSDMNGAAVSVGATEARLAVAPQGEVIPVLEPGKPTGFSIRRESGQ